MMGGGGALCAPLSDEPKKPALDRIKNVRT